MANYTTAVSFVLPLTLGQKEWALSVKKLADSVGDRGSGSLYLDTVAAIKSGAESTVVEAAAQLVEYGSSGVQTEDYDGALAHFGPCSEEMEWLWVHGDEDAQPEWLADWISKIITHFELDVCWGFQWSLGCSKARLDAYGGGAVTVTKDGPKFLSTSEWLNKEVETFLKTKQPEEKGTTS